MGPSTTSWVLLLAFFVVVALEMFLPSAGILFVLSVILAMAAIVFGFMHSLTLGTIMIAIIVFSMPVLFAAFAYIWPHTPLGRRFINQAPQADQVLPQDMLSNSMQSLLGEKALVTSPMRPSGTVEIDGKSYTATSNGGALDPGVWVRVVEIRMRRLFVIPVEIADDHQAPGGFEHELDRAVEANFEARPEGKFEDLDDFTR